MPSLTVSNPRTPLFILHYNDTLLANHETTTTAMTIVAIAQVRKIKQMVTATFRFLLLDVILQSTFSHLCKSAHKAQKKKKKKSWL